ncbi:MAG: hypothetical protein QOG14_2279, partial [Mycobacterium sp.]|nr:hypothetical protein [Mycobacterium sp.]
LRSEAPLPDETVRHNAAMGHESMPAAQTLWRTVTVIVTALAPDGRRTWAGERQIETFVFNRS